MRTLIPLGFFFSLVVLLPACDSSSPLGSSVLDGSDSTPDEIVGTTWQLTALRTPGGTRYVPDQLVGRHDGDEVYTLQFLEEGKLEGTADCNTYGADYLAENEGILAVSSLVMTRIYCGEGSRENLYGDALGRVEAYAVEGDRLRLGYDSKGLLTFTRR